MQAMNRGRRLRVSSYDDIELPRPSPFFKSKKLKDYMMACLVNNSIFHSDFDPTLVERENIAMAKELLDVKTVN